MTLDLEELGSVEVEAAGASSRLLRSFLCLDQRLMSLNAIKDAS